MATRTPLIAGNWKMFKTASQARQFCEALPAEVKGMSDPELVLCPPFTAIQTVVEALSGTHIKVGGQNMHWLDDGAFTGEVAPGMLTETGCSHVILGHSERRQHFGESDGSVNRKVVAALTHGLTPIVCVGEKLEEREVQLTDNVVIIQVQRALLNVAPEQVPQIVFAYEPIWAIGTGKTCDPREADRVCGIIRETVAKVAGPEAGDRVRVLYGGSVKPETIGEQMAQREVDGALVGGASLDPASFAAIARFRLSGVR